jgi:hypothetical protein
MKKTAKKATAHIEKVKQRKAAVRKGIRQGKIARGHGPNP